MKQQLILIFIKYPVDLSMSQRDQAIDKDDMWTH